MVDILMNEAVVGKGQIGNLVDVGKLVEVEERDRRRVYVLYHNNR